MARNPMYAALSVAVALIIGASASAQELLTNPAFEEIADNGLPAGWKQYAGGVPESQLEISDDAHAGQHSVRVIDTGPEERDGRWSIGVQQDVPAEPGKHYLLSVWNKCAARNNDGAMNLQLRFLPSSKSHTVKLTPEIGGDWQQFFTAGQAPEDTTSIRVYIYSEHYWTCDSLIDGASVQEVNAEKWGARFPLLALGSQGIEKARELNLRTPLVQGGQPAATILIPEGEDYAALGKRLADAIAEKTGATLPVTTEGKPLVESPETVIALGNLNNNWVIERLYWNKYLEINSLKPGAGKYVLQTVHEPYNSPQGKNVLVIGASDLDGLTAGVEDFIGRIQQGADLVLAEPLLLVSGVTPLDEAAREKLLAQEPDIHALRRFWDAARQYRDTGDLAYAENAKRILLFCGERFMENPRYHVTWPEETTSNMLGAMWDVLEEAPVFTDEERLQCANILLATLYSLPPRCSGYGNLEKNDTIIWNHTTFPLMGIYWLARYFDRYYGNVDGRMELMLEKVRAAFAGQVTCWKPQEDSCGYVSIVPRHTIEYTLAENDYTHFENGSVRRHAEYEVGFCDNTGDAAGFGDSGYGRGVYNRNIHWALWYYKDGRFLWWMDRVLENGYQNPYHPEVKPVPWRDLVGLNLFELHPQVYEYTRTRADYGGEPTPPNIPVEKAFDKIAFRENLSPNGEYFLLDGYSRGKHLQYDGNAIIKFYADGHDWLIDGDYLVRNTTDHNMVSVIREGRCAELEPSCAAVECIADLPTAGMTETAVYDYNGADWVRNIFWLKGQFVVVMDRLRAREAGKFTFLGNWKTLAEGDQELTEARIFETSRKGYGEIGNRDLITVTKPAEGVERAVKFATAYSQLDIGLELAAGKYEMTLFASGTGTGSDSFYVAIDAGETVAFHIPINVFGPSSSEWTKDTPTPNIEVPTDGLHRITITLREGPGPMLDRILIRDAQGKAVADLQAEEAPPVPDEWIKPAPSSDFYVKSDGHAACKLATRINHVGRHITYLRERFGGELQTREACALHNIFYNDTDESPKGYDLRRISEEAVVVLKDGQPWIVCAAGDEATLDGQVEAKMVMFSLEQVWAGGVTGASGYLAASEPVAAEFDIAAAQVVITAPSDETTLSVAGIPMLFTDRRVEMDLAGYEQLTEEIWRLEDAFASFTARVQEPPPAAQQGPTVEKALAVAWEQEIPVEQGRETDPILKLYPTDLDGDGTDEVIVLRGQTAHCLDAAGNTLWNFPTGAITRAVCAADLDGDGAVEVLVGSDDEMIYVLDAAGNKLREHHADIPLRVGRSSVRQPRVGALGAADLDGDGTTDILAGLLNANLVRYDPDFNLIWRVDSIEHGTREMELLDLDRDGKLEVACANKYGHVEIFSADGHQLPGPYSELGDVDMAFGDMDGDGQYEIANGSSTGAFTCQTFRGDVKFRFPNYGFAVRQTLMADVRGDGNAELLVASETGYVYILGPEGEVLAQRDFGDVVNDLAVLDGDGKSRIAAACADGGIYVLDGDANLSAGLQLDAGVELVAVLRAEGGPCLLAATAGTLACLTP